MSPSKKRRPLPAVECGVPGSKINHDKTKDPEIKNKNKNVVFYSFFPGENYCLIRYLKYRTRMLS